MNDLVPDNPYRLLGVRSDTLQSDLKVLAGAAITTHKAQSSEFDRGAAPDDGEPKAPSLVGPIADLMDRDPALRTAYRLLWPLAYSSSETAGKVAPGINFNRLEAEALALPEFYAAQVRFLSRWDGFRERPTGKTVSEAFALYRSFTENPAALEFLTGLLLKEGVDHGVADTAVKTARNRVAESLLSSAAESAIACWSADNAPDALNIMEAITTSSLPDEAVSNAVQHLATIGRSEEVALTASLPVTVDSLRNNPKTPLRGLYLWRISSLLRGSLPEADRWAATYGKSVESIVTMTIHASTDLAFLSNEPQAAISLVESLALQPLPPYLVERVNAYLPEFRKNVAKGPTHGGEFRLVKRAPIMWIINGAGSRVADEKPCLERPGWNWVTYYKVFMWMSIFPVRRYLVKTVSKGRWHFYASAPLEPRVQRSKRIGCGVALAAVLGFAVIGSLLPSTPTGSTPSDSTTSTSRSEDTDGTLPLVKKQFEIEAALDAAGGPIEQQTDQLSKRKKALDKARAQINPKDATALKANDSAMAQWKKDKDKLNESVTEYNQKFEQLRDLDRQIEALKPSK